MKAYNTPNDELRIESDSGDELVKITSDGVTAKSGLGSMPKISLTEEEFFVAMSGTKVTKKASDIEGFPMGDFASNMTSHISVVIPYNGRQLTLVEDFRGIGGNNDWITFSSVVLFRSAIFFALIEITSDSGYVNENSTVYISGHLIAGGD